MMCKLFLQMIFMIKFTYNHGCILRNPSFGSNVYDTAPILPIKSASSSEVYQEKTIFDSQSADEELLLNRRKFVNRIHDKTSDEDEKIQLHYKQQKEIDLSLYKQFEKLVKQELSALTDQSSKITLSSASRNSEVVTKPLIGRDPKVKAITAWNSNPSVSKYYPQSVPAPVEIPSCYKYTQCSQCRYPCVWCHNHGCTYVLEELCPFVVNKNLQAGNESPCPRISHDGPIIVPAGVRTLIKVKIFAPDPEIYNEKISCQIRFKERFTKLRAVIDQDVVHCNPVTLDTNNHAIFEGQLRVIWGGVVKYSNLLYILTYNCEAIAFNNESCQMIPKHFGCGWCDKSNKCVIDTKCFNDLERWTFS